jgi:hypothetical protein
MEGILSMTGVTNYWVARIFFIEVFILPFVIILLFYDWTLVIDMLILGI